MTLTNVHLEDCFDSLYIRPQRMFFDYQGQRRSWDMVQVYDSVAILLFDPEHQNLVLVRQLRPPVYLRNNDGFTYELCAGIVDKDKPLADIAREEILEECGYLVPPDQLHQVNSFYTAIGFAASRQTIFFAEVSDALKISDGGGNPQEHERIEVVHLPVDQAKNLMYDENIAKTSGLLYAFYWFFEQVAPQYLDNKPSFKKP